MNLVQDDCKSDDRVPCNNQKEDIFSLNLKANCIILQSMSAIEAYQEVKMLVATIHMTKWLQQYSC